MFFGQGFKVYKFFGKSGLLIILYFYNSKIVPCGKGPRPWAETEDFQTHLDRCVSSSKNDTDSVLSFKSLESATITTDNATLDLVPFKIFSSKDKKGSWFNTRIQLQSLPYYNELDPFAPKPLLQRRVYNCVPKPVL